MTRQDSPHSPEPQSGGVEWPATDLTAHGPAERAGDVPQRYGTTKLATIVRDFDRLRRAIQSHDPEATEAAWLNAERWLDFAMAVKGREGIRHPAGAGLRWEVERHVAWHVENSGMTPAAAWGEVLELAKGWERT